MLSRLACSFDRRPATEVVGGDSDKALDMWLTSFAILGICSVGKAVKSRVVSTMSTRISNHGEIKDQGGKNNKDQCRIKNKFGKALILPV